MPAPRRARGHDGAGAELQVEARVALRMARVDAEGTRRGRSSLRLEKEALAPRIIHTVQGDTTLLNNTGVPPPKYPGKVHMYRIFWSINRGWVVPKLLYLACIPGSHQVLR